MHHSLSRNAVFTLLALLLALPLALQWGGQDFYIGVATRILIFALAVNSLNLILGFGGLVSLGHAAWLGCGAYVVGILAQHDIHALWLSWPLALLAGVLLATLIGSICLRTRGVYFIMITLAFAQMLYFLAISLKNYGGEDGMTLATRSHIGFAIDNDLPYYYLVLAVFVLISWLMLHLVNARFGRTLQAIRLNELRMEALGYPVFRFKLAAFAIAGGMASLAGAMLADLNLLVTPNLLHWTQSGSLMVMTILGGVGSISCGLLGATSYLLLEEVLSSYTTHWQLVLGIVLLIVVLRSPNGLSGLLTAHKNTHKKEVQ